MTTKKREISLSGALLTGVFNNLSNAVAYINKNREKDDKKAYEVVALASLAISALEFLITGEELPKPQQKTLEKYIKITEDKTKIEMKDK